VRSPRALGALAILLAGCAGSSTVTAPPRRPVDDATTRDAGAAPARAAAPTAPAGDARPVAWVGERAVTERDLLETILFFYRREYHDALNQAVNDVVVEEETKRLGVTVDQREVTRRAEDEIARLEGELLVQFGGEVKLETFVRDNFRLSVEEYRAKILRVVRGRLLIGRLVRYEEMRQERLELRKIVVADRAKAEAIVASLRDGADFAILAEKESMAPSAKVGGRLPPVPLGALHPELEAAALALADGAVSDPIELREGPVARYHVVKRLRRIPARDVAYADAREEIEKGIEAEPVSDAEIAYWNEAMTRRYGIRFAD